MAHAAEHRIPRWSASAFVAVCVLGAVTGCSEGSSAAGTATIVENPAQAELVQLGESLFGDQQQRRAGELIFYHSANDAVSTCMTARGNENRPFAFIDMNTSWGAIDALSPMSSWLVTPGDVLVVEETLDLQRQGAELEAAQPIGDDEYMEDSYACADDGNEAQRPNTPPSAREALVTFGPMLDEAVLATAPLDSYGDCVAELGFPGVEEPGDLTGSVFEQLPVQATFEEKGQLAIPLMADAQAADVACRAETYLQVVQAVAAAGRLFERENASAIEAAQAGWDDLVAEASTYPEW